MEFYMRFQDTVIREYKKSDLDAVHRMLACPEVYATTCAIPYMCSRSFAAAWIDNIRRCIKRQTDFEYGIFSAQNGEYIGNVGLIGIDYRNKKADITYIITPQFQHRGYAVMCSKLLISYGFERLGLIRIHGKCMDFNLASKSVMQKCGFIYEGKGRSEMLKDDRRIDLEHYSLLKEEYLRLKQKIYYPNAYLPNIF